MKFNHGAGAALFPVLRRILATLPLAVTLGVLSGCRLLVGTTVVVVGAVGLIGYGVYKTGEVAVTGVGSAVSSGAKGVGSVVFFNGDFKATCNGTVEDVWLASSNTLKAKGFRSVSGKRDGLSGSLEAIAANEDELKITLEAVGTGETEIRIRIGVTGDLKKSETLYHLITTELAQQRGTPRQSST